MCAVSYYLEFRIMNSSPAGVSVVKIMDGDSTACRGIKLSNMTNLYFFRIYDLKHLDRSRK